MQTSIFNFKQNQLSVLTKDNGELWFIASEVCEALGLSDTSKAVRALIDSDKGKTSVPTPGGIQDKIIINESGLYSLIFKSKKDEAVEFQRWVTSEVLPSIRKTGQYLIKPIDFKTETDIKQKYIEIRNQKIIQAISDKVDIEISNMDFDKIIQTISPEKPKVQLITKLIDGELRHTPYQINEMFSDGENKQLHYYSLLRKENLVTGKIGSFQLTEKGKSHQGNIIQTNQGKVPEFPESVWSAIMFKVSVGVV